MSDTNFSYMEVSAKRKKRNQFISVLIIVAIVLLGVIVWGWVELQKSRNAERIKHALNSQVEPGFREPEITPPPAQDTGSVIVQDAAPVIPEPVITAPEPVEPLVAKDPQPKTVVTPPTPARKEVKQHEPEKGLGAKPQAVVESKSVAKKREEPVQIAMNRPDPIPESVKPGSPPKEKPVPTVSKPPVAKTFPPEDLPLPAKPVATEELKQAVATLPKAGPTASGEAASASNHFKLGMEAYKQQDFVNAIRSFAAVPRPATKKRGSADRDEYVQASFLRGVSLLKVGHMSEAVSAFQGVLEFEKYYPMANMNLGICYVELKQYAKAHQAFEAVIRDQNRLDPAAYDDVMQRTKYFWALAWTRLYKTANNPDKQNYYRSQAVQKWKDYQVWFSKNEKFKEENIKAENYLKSLSSL